MIRLPRYRVPRPRIEGLLEPASVGVVEAAGYGKPSLAAKCAEAFGAAHVGVAFEARDWDGEFFAARVGQALRPLALGPAAAPGGDPVETVEAAAAALAAVEEPVLLELDHAHHCGGEGVALLRRLATSLSRPHRSLVLCRRLPRGAESLRRLPGAAVLDTDALAQEPEEVAAVLAAGASSRRCSRTSCRSISRSWTTSTAPQSYTSRAWPLVSPVLTDYFTREEIGRATSGADGSFSVEAAKAGPYKLEARTPVALAS